MMRRVSKSISSSPLVLSLSLLLTQSLGFFQTAHADVAKREQVEAVSIADKFVMESEVFESQRTLRVSLPESYQTNQSQAYPVIYVARGQLDLLVTVASLNLLDEEVPEFIVVGFDGSGGEFLPGENGNQSQLSRFVHEEMIPLINQQYRTADFDILLGHSNAGRYVANEWLERGSDFDHYIAISPSMDDGHINTQAKALDDKQRGTKKTLLLTLANEQRGMIEPFNELKTIFSGVDNVSFASFPKQTHMSVRGDAIMHGLRQIFTNWKPAKELENGTLEPLLDHYAGLTKRFGFEVSVPADTLRRMAGFHTWKEHPERNQYSRDVVKYLIERDPREVDELVDIAQQLKAYGSPDGSLRLIASICVHVPEHEVCQ